MDERKFQAWLDGQLDAAARAAVEAEVATDPELQRRAERMRAAQMSLRTAFGPEPRYRTAPEQDGHGPGAGPWLVLAATLAADMFAGAMIGAGQHSPVIEREGRLVAASELSKALDRQLASDGERDGIVVSLSFRNREGAFCRRFSSAVARGLACRDGEQWLVRGLFAAPPAGQLTSLVATEMEGQPLDEAAERQARDNGWR